MINSPIDYYNLVIGKKFDMDGMYGCQCVDGFKHFCNVVYELNLGSICSPTGYAASIWDNAERLGLLEYFDKVASNEMVDGDWAIWDTGSRSCPYSHVAMFRCDNGNGTGLFLGENQLGHPEFTEINIYYDGIRGALRPKVFHKPKESNLYKTLGNMYLRYGAGLNYGIKLVSEMTEDGKNHAVSSNPNAYAVYKEGTIFSCLQKIENDYGVWAKTPSGYICLIGASGKVYCEEVN